MIIILKIFQAHFLCKNVILKDCVLFIVRNRRGHTFVVRPRGSFELRRQWMKDINSIIGKKLTVRYQELTDDGIPRFPVGISIRDYEG